jgi:hypothetical protein
MENRFRNLDKNLNQQFPQNNGKYSPVENIEKIQSGGIKD